MKNKVSTVIRFLFLLIGIVCLMIGGYFLIEKIKNEDIAKKDYEKVIDNALQNDGNQKQKNDEDQKQEVFPYDIQYLLSINSDFVAWVKVGDYIDYPIVKGADNSHYLYYTFENQPNNVGCIFMNLENTSDLSDGNTVLYGHNMLNGSMFGTIREFKNKAIYDEVKTIVIYTVDKRKLTYEICSFQEARYDSPNYYLGNTSDEKKEIINEIQMNSVYKLNIQDQLKEHDKIITLSTCRKGVIKSILQGVLVEEKVYN